MNRVHGDDSCPWVDVVCTSRVCNNETPGAADVSLCIDGLPACRLLPPAAATTTTAFTATFLLLTLQLTTICEPPVPSEGG